MKRLVRVLLLLLLAGSALAEPLRLTLEGEVTVAFTPGDDAAGLIVRAIESARRQILVQAYSFTHRAIADALIAARRRGVQVQVLADPEQRQRIATSRVDDLVRGGVTVYLDGQHAAAHDKVMILDAGEKDAVLITGSFNFTHAAQFRNSENLLLIRGAPLLIEAYAANWRRHRAHSQLLKVTP